MNDVKLIDFTAHELQILLTEVVMAIAHANEEGNRYVVLCLWRTQILNAISTVKMRETTQAN